MTSTSSPNNRGRSGRRRPRPYRPREVREAGISPAKSLGQHFLSDRNIVRRIIDSAGLKLDDVVIEVGPGLGVLTELLAETAGRVIAVEIDPALVARLREKFADVSSVWVTEGDVLRLRPEKMLDAAGIDTQTSYQVVANLPYNAGAAIVRHFLEADRPPVSMVVMLQREVADSICAAPGEMSLLGVSVQVYAEARHLFNVPPRAFYPPPKVTSGVIRIDRRQAPLLALEERERFFEMVRAGFSAPRKQLRNSIAQGLGVTTTDAAGLIQAARIDPTLRPQALSVDDWLGLARAQRA